jgi:hypothetical protein
MASFRIRFCNDLLNAYGQPFHVCQREVVVAGEDDADAIQAAKAGIRKTRAGSQLAAEGAVDRVRVVARTGLAERWPTPGRDRRTGRAILVGRPDGD